MAKRVGHLEQRTPVGKARQGVGQGLDALLHGYRGDPPADRASLVDAIVRIAALAAGLGSRLAAIDLNPVIVGPAGGGATVVDARIVVDP